MTIVNCTGACNGMSILSFLSQCPSNKRLTAELDSSTIMKSSNNFYLPLCNYFVNRNPWPHNKSGRKLKHWPAAIEIRYFRFFSTAQNILTTFL